MPLPSEAAAFAAGGRSDDEILEDVLLQSMQDAAGEVTAADAPPSQPPSGISFAKITKMGYAATGMSQPPSDTRSKTDAGETSCVFLKCLIVMYVRPGGSSCWRTFLGQE
jgi:hypothetical protein